MRPAEASPAKADRDVFMTPNIQDRVSLMESGHGTPGPGLPFSPTPDTVTEDHSAHGKASGSKSWLNLTSLAPPIVLAVTALYALVVLVVHAVAFASTATEREYPHLSLVLADASLAVRHVAIDRSAASLATAEKWLDKLHKYAGKTAEEAVSRSVVDRARVLMLAGQSDTAAAALESQFKPLIGRVRATNKANFDLIWSVLSLSTVTSAARGTDVPAASITHAPRLRNASDLVEKLIGAGSAFTTLSGVTEQFYPPATKQAVDSFTNWFESSKTAVSTSVAYAVEDVYVDDAKLLSESLATMDALKDVVSRVNDDLNDRDTSDDALAIFGIALLAGLLIASSVAAAVTILLTHYHKTTQHVLRVMRRGFVVSEDGPIMPEKQTIESVSEHCAKFSVMDGDVQLMPDPCQLALALQTARHTLNALRPFIPDFVFLRHGQYEAFGSLHPRMAMQISLESDFRCAIVYIGLRNICAGDDDDALDAFNEFLSIVHVCADRWDGTVAQTSFDSIIIIFSNDADEENPVTFEAELRAAHASFAILANASGRVDLPISIAVVAGSALHGQLASHASRSYAIVSPMIGTARTLEALNETYETCILTDGSMAHVIEGRMLTRPIALLKHADITAYEIAVEKPLEGIPEYDTALRQYTKLSEKLAFWGKVWERYDEACEMATPDKLEEAYKEMQTYRTFFLPTQEAVNDDVAFTAATAHLRRSLLDLGVAVDTETSDDEAGAAL